MNFIKKMPWTISALVLGIAALGNLLQSYSETLRYVIGAIAGILFILFTIKILTDFDGFKEFLNNPLNLGVFTTYPMALNLLAGYIRPSIPGLAMILWVISVLGIISVMIAFTVKYLVKKDISLIFASAYIVYSGIAVAAITAPAFNMQELGKIFFWVSLIGYIFMTPIVFKRVFSLKTIPEPAIPTNAIITAPLSLTIAGYNASYGGSQNLILLAAMIIFAQLVYFYVVTKIPMIFTTPFKPSFAGFTFPIVISAIALKTTNAFLNNSGNGIPALGILVKIEELIAVVVIAYLFYLFMKATFAPSNN